MVDDVHTKWLSCNLFNALRDKNQKYEVQHMIDQTKLISGVPISKFTHPKYMWHAATSKTKLLLIMVCNIRSYIYVSPDLTVSVCTINTRY